MRPPPNQITIRRALRGWFTYLQLSLLGVGVLASAWRDNGYNHGFRAVILALVLASVFGLFVCGFRCPRCRTSLIHRSTALLADRGVAACPRCGVSFDEPVAQKKSGQPARPT
jgi:hypothetical protein